MAVSPEGGYVRDAVVVVGYSKRGFSCPSIPETRRSMEVLSKVKKKKKSRRWIEKIYLLLH